MKRLRSTEIGATEARTRLYELLREIRSGRRFTITNCGEVVAELVPSEAAQNRCYRAAIEKFQDFLAKNPIQGEAKLRRLIEEGRE